jgi:hypothetical protein
MDPHVQIDGVPRMAMGFKLGTQLFGLLVAEGRPRFQECPTPVSKVLHILYHRRHCTSIIPCSMAVVNERNSDTYPI